MRHHDLDLDFDNLDQTIRMDAPVIPPDAMPDTVRGAMLVDEDTPTLVVVPSALAALAERSAETVPVFRPVHHRADEEIALRRMVYGIWAVAAVLFATLGLLVR